MYSTVVGLLFTCLSVQLSNGELAGNIVTTTDVKLNIYKTLILDKVQFMNGIVTGFYVSFGEANCPVKVQLWHRRNSLQYELFWESSPVSRSSPGVGFVNVSTPVFVVGEIDRLGFTSLDDVSSCIAFVLKNNSETLFCKETPALGTLHPFATYLEDYMFGLQMEYTLSGNELAMSDPLKSGVPVMKEVIGFHVDATKTAAMGRSSLILEGLRLKEGWLHGYKVRMETAGCTIALQIWYPDTGNKYHLKGQTIFTSASTGYFEVEAIISNRFAVDQEDRLGFTSYHQSSSCVPYLFVSDMTRRKHAKTVFYHFSGSNHPKVNSSYKFIPYQTTMLFAIQLEVLIAVDQVTGGSGPPGLPGATGATGSSGSPGLPGHSGPLGEPGDKGIDGDNGLPGPTGLGGPPGSKGPQGLTGPNGPSGLTGLAGKAGLIGATGEIGQKGPAGQRGPWGFRGSQGLPGSTGAIGMTGEAPRGSVGQTGVAGPLGATGQRGDIGPQGPGGPNGMIGFDGRSGVTGPVGPMWLPLGADYCKTISLNCMHFCENTDLGPRCRCYPGYRLVGLTDCEEIDECKCENGGCQYFCTNTNGSYFCHCPLGLRLSKDDHRCDDIDECKEKSDNCFSDQLCMNTWTTYYCAGPFDDSSSFGKTAALISGQTTFITRNIIIGLILWMVILTLLIFTSVILLIPDMKDCCGGKRAPPRRPQEFYYPSFMPRISLDHGRGSNKDMLDSARSNEGGGVDNLGADLLDETPERDGGKENEGKRKDQ